MSKPVSHYGKWRIRWLDENSNRHSAVYPTHKEAAFQLTRREVEVAEIIRGLRAPTPRPHTFNELCDKYLTNRSSLKRRPRDDEGIIRVHLRPSFGPLQLNAIGVEQIDDFKHTKVHLAPKTLHHHLTLFRTIMGYALELGWITQLPRIKKPRIRLFDNDFRYLRTKTEIERFLLGARKEGELVFALYATATFTGLRQGEIAGLRWEDIDFARRLITVQRSFEGPTKTGEVRYVPILDALLPILRNWRLIYQGQIVFPSESDTIQQPSGRIFQEVFWRVLDHAEFPKTEREGKTRRHITFHSLRHTFASHWMMRGGDIFRLQRILGHKSIQMTQRYSHLAPDAFASDYALLGASPMILPAEVVSIVDALSCN